MRLEVSGGSALPFSGVSRSCFRTSPAPQSPLLAIAPGPTQVLASSVSLGWRGLLVEKHFTSPGERISASIDRHVISMFSGAPSRLEHRAPSSRFVECIARPGRIMITPAGLMPDVRLHTSSEIIHCALENELVDEVARETDRRSSPKPVFQAAVQDESIRRMLTMLIEELESGQPVGRLYVESLAHALANRYVQLDEPSQRNQGTSALPRRILNRVREKIEADLEADLSLDSLAEEAGYSRAHFVRMFRAATGVTPHQYVLDLRLSRAQNYLREGDASIIDVAVCCGFSSQSHMTSLFRERLEMTPAEFRRRARTSIQTARAA